MLPETFVLDQRLMDGRLMPRKLQRKPVNAKSRRESVIVTLTASVNGNEESAAVAVDVAVVAVEISIDAHLDTQGPRPHGDVARLIIMTTAVHRLGAKWIHTFLANVALPAEMREDVVRDPSGARFPAPDLDPSHPHAVGCATMTDRDPTDVAITPADPGRRLLEDEVPEGKGEEGVRIVVITEQDP